MQLAATTTIMVSPWIAYGALSAALLVLGSVSWLGRRLGRARTARATQNAARLYQQIDDERAELPQQRAAAEEDFRQAESLGSVERADANHLERQNAADQKTEQLRESAEEFLRGITLTLDEAEQAGAITRTAEATTVEVHTERLGDDAAAEHWMSRLAAAGGAAHAVEQELDALERLPRLEPDTREWTERVREWNEHNAPAFHAINQAMGQGPAQAAGGSRDEPPPPISYVPPSYTGIPPPPGLRRLTDSPGGARPDRGRPPRAREERRGVQERGTHDGRR